MRDNFMLFYKWNGLFRFILFLLLFSITSFILILEFYYQYGQCAVSEEYSRKNTRLTHRTMDMLENLSLPYWPDCQSLLNVLRNETYNIWDHDVDFSIEWPFESKQYDSKLNNIQKLIQKIETYNFNVEFYVDRRLLSLSYQKETSSRQSHVDIWLWTRNYENKSNEQTIVLKLIDYSFKYQNRLISDMYPLKSLRWLGRNITIPFASHTIANKEYGASYMTAIAFRKNCFHNLIDGRWM